MQQTYLSKNSSSFQNISGFHMKENQIKNLEPLVFFFIWCHQYYKINLGLFFCGHKAGARVNTTYVFYDERATIFSWKIPESQLLVGFRAKVKVVLIFVSTTKTRRRVDILHVVLITIDFHVIISQSHFGSFSDDHWLFHLKICIPFRIWKKSQRWRQKTSRVSFRQLWLFCFCVILWYMWCRMQFQTGSYWNSYLEIFSHQKNQYAIHVRIWASESQEMWWSSKWKFCQNL